MAQGNNKQFSAFLAAGRALLVALFVAVITACGGGGTEPPPPPPGGDTTPPTVLSISPSNGATDVGTNTPITVTFSEAIQCSAPLTQGTFGEITGALTCVTANAAGHGIWTLVPTNPYTNGKHYGYIFSGYRDLAGNIGASITGGFTVVAVPPPGDVTPPTLLGVSMTDGATNVPTVLPSVSYTFSENVLCKKAVTLTVPALAYAVVGTTTCSGKVLTFTSEATKVYGTRHTLTLPVGAVTDMAGNGLATTDVRYFTSVKPAVSGIKLFTGNNNISTGQRMSVVDVTTGISTNIVFPEVPGFRGVRNVVVDGLTGKVHFGPMITFKIYTADLVTDQVLEPIAIDQNYDYIHGVEGLALTDDSLCATFARIDIPVYPRHNQLVCWNRVTLTETFASPKDYLAPGTMTQRLLRYLPFGGDKKLFALSVASSALDIEVYDGGHIREAYLPGTLGRVVEIDAGTKAITRTFVVGSVPLGIDRDPLTGDLYVVNSGDKTLSVITHATGQVTTVPLPTFTGLQRPMRILIDRPRGQFFVTNDWDAVAVFSLATRQEIGRVTVGNQSMSVELLMVRGLLYVTNSNNNPAGNSVSVIDPATLTVTRTIAVFRSPWGIAAYDPAP